MHIQYSTDCFSGNIEAVCTAHKLPYQLTWGQQNSRIDDVIQGCNILSKVSPFSSDLEKA